MRGLHPLGHLADAVIVLLVACARDPGAPPAGSLGNDPAPVDPISRLVRASLDVRGVRPTVEEVAELEADPGAIDGMLDEFLADARYEARVREAFQQVLRTRSEAYLVFDGLSLDDPDAFVRSVGEEPLRMVGRIAMDDYPYTELVTGDWTMLDEHLAQTYDSDYPVGATGWQVAHYTDGRPRAGVLGTNGLFWRYPTTASNKNRKRANQVSRIFTCYDFLLTEIPFDPDIDLLDEDALEDAISTDPSCTGCHADLDPIASNLYGFWYFYDDGYHLADASIYHPELERKWLDETGVAPGWFGAPTTGLPALPSHIVGDPMFVPCAVQHAFRHLAGREPVGTDDLTVHERAFALGGFTIRSLWRSVLSDPAYVALDPLAPGAVGLKIATPDVLASAVEGLTGYRMLRGPIDVLASDEEGVLTLAGGADGAVVTEPLRAPSTTALLVQARLADAAASFVVAEDKARGAEARVLLRKIDFTEAPGSADAAIAAQIQDLFLRIQTRRVAIDGPEVAGQAGLFAEVYALDGTPDAAWGAVIAAMLRSPDFLLY